MGIKKQRQILSLIRAIAAQAQNGLAYSKNPFDINHYTEIINSLQELSIILANNDSSELTSILANLPKVRLDISNEDYITPQVAVATAVFSNNSVLLVKRSDNLWSLPGGYADIGRDPIQNALKEVKEETGFDVTISQLIGIYDSNVSEFPTNGRQVYTLTFFGTIVGGSLTPDPVETQGVAFFETNGLPPIPPMTMLQIAQGIRVISEGFVNPQIDRYEIN